MKKGTLSRNSKLISLILTILIVLAVLLSGPASAVRVGLINFPETAEVGDKVEFQAYVDIETNERVPFVYFMLEINNNSCIFLPNGTLIITESTNTTICQSFNITPSHNYLDYGYGNMFGYGYGYDNSIWGYQNYTFGEGYGYGSGYGYGYPNYQTSELLFNITWNTTGFDADTYNVRFYAFANKNGLNGQEYDYAFASSVYSISLSTPAPTTTTSTLPTTTISGGYPVSTGPTRPSTTVISDKKAFSYLGSGKEGESYIFNFSRARDLGIREIEIKFATNSTGIRIEVERLDSLPSDVRSPIGAIVSTTGEIYAIFSINCSVPNENITLITIRFDVPRSWIEENNIDPGTIKLARYLPGGWIDLPTRLVSVDEEYYHFEAISSGFSYFAIVGEKIVPTTIPPTTIIPTTIPPTTTIQTTIAPTTIPTAREEGTWIIAVGIVILIIAILVLFSLLWRGSKKTAGVQQE